MNKIQDPFQFFSTTAKKNIREFVIKGGGLGSGQLNNPFLGKIS